MMGLAALTATVKMRIGSDNRGDELPSVTASFLANGIKYITQAGHQHSTFSTEMTIRRILNWFLSRLPDDLELRYRILIVRHKQMYMRLTTSEEAALTDVTTIGK